VVLDEACGLPEEYRQDAAGERIEGSAMADPLRRGQPPDEPDDVV
jgi:hypothetical protein